MRVACALCVTEIFRSSITRRVRTDLMQGRIARVYIAIRQK